MLKYGLTILAIIMLGFTARADESLNCDAYANEAVKDQSENINNKCGFTGGRWSLDFVGHYNWCQSPSVAMVNLTDEDKARKKSLATCKTNRDKPFIFMPGVVSETPKVKQCNIYANQAIAAAKKSVQYNCGFTDGRFADDRDGHYNWCMGQSESVVSAEATKRDNILKSCTVPGSQKAACELYANGAMPLVPEHIKVCRTEHPVPTRKELIDFCHRVGPINAIKENQKLATEIDHCKKYPPNEIKVFKNLTRGYTKSGRSFRLELDYCGSPGKNCGQNNANKYCRSKGYDVAKTFKTKVVERAPYGGYTTYFQDPMKAWRGRRKAFSEIECAKI